MATSLIRQESAHGLTLRKMASAADIELVDVQSRFPTWNHLLVASVNEWHSRRLTAAQLVAQTHGAAAFLRSVVIANLADPNLTRALVAIASIAILPDHPLSPTLRREWLKFYSVLRDALIVDIREGREPHTMDPDFGAEQLVSLYEGLQIQSFLRPDMDLLWSYDRAVSRLRNGWTHRRDPLS